MQRDILKERAAIDEAVAGKTICTLFAERVAASAQNDAIRWNSGQGWESLTWSEYGQRVRAASVGLLQMGFRSGDFGLIMARNRAEHVIADLALVHAGGTAISVYNTLAPEQIAYVANHSEATVAFVEDVNFLEKFLSMRHRLPHLRLIVLVAGSAAADAVTSWDQLLAAGAAEEERRPGTFEESWRNVKPEDIAALIYTSGTTGPPKGVMYTHTNLLWTLEASVQNLGNEPGQRWVSYLPLAHVAERFSTHWGSLYNGATVYQCPEPAQLMTYLLEARPTAFVGVPRLWEKLYAAINAGVAADPDENRRAAVQAALGLGRRLAALERSGQEPPPDLAARAEAIEPVLRALRARIGLDQCQRAITSTAPTPTEIHEFFAGIGLPLIEVWGMSELTGPATSNPIEAIKLGTVGPTINGVEAKLAEDGEILVRGGNVMAGYYKDPEQTAETIDSEGWVHSGDIATVDEDGYYRIVDRKKELIITSGGKNISPANIESLLKHHPLVGQAIAIGDGRKFVSALIVLDQETAPAWARSRGIVATSVDDLASHPEVVAEVSAAVAEANTHLAQVEAVKRFTILPTEWTAESEELTPTLKLKRRVVNQKYAAEIEGMYAEQPAGHEARTPIPEPASQHPGGAEPAALPQG